MVRIAQLRTIRLGFVIYLAAGPDACVFASMRVPILVLVLGLGSSACDFFRELESLPEAGEDGSDDGTTDASDESGTDGGPCDVLDESCPTQDTLEKCDAESGELVNYDCAGLCGQGGQLNFTCTPTADFQHGCWCVDPGGIKLDSCVDLEICVAECGGDPTSPCVEQCFGRTDAQTVRLLGTLFACADRVCDDVCAAAPADCGSCLLSARAGLWGDCGVEREVCNADQVDEPGWP